MLPALAKNELIRARTILGRELTAVEQVIFAIQWSEHCSYKSSKRFLKTFPTTSPHVILGPGEDSGIIAITDEPKGERFGIVISHESHNHPSQIVPYEGAATGIGGVVRDVLCMGARVIGCADMLRFGDLNNEETRTIAREVIRGIAGYGNPIGVPNLGGSTKFDPGYNANCLVNAVAVGIVREGEVIHSFTQKEAGKAGYDIIVVGKPTDRSGFGGATFASETFEHGTAESKSGAVQEPNPFLERHLMASTYDLFEWLKRNDHLHQVSFKDLGAGGIVCASVEQVAPHNFGAEIELTRIHVSIPHLPPEIIACAETQERMCWICHPDITSHILIHYNETWNLPEIAENARASVIGKVTEDGIYRLRFKGNVVCEAKSTDITCGIEVNRPTKPHPLRPLPILNDLNNASKHPIFLHFDKNVIGNTVVEPGEAPASVIMPLQDQGIFTGVVLGCGGPLLPDPYEQGRRSALDAIAKVVSLGAEPRALTDCLNYGNPEIPEHLWDLEQGVRGIRDVAEETGVPVISGNVSLFNSGPDGKAIPPSAICCAIGVIDDARDIGTQTTRATFTTKDENRLQQAIFGSI